MKYYAIIGQTGCTCDESSNPITPEGHVEMQGPPLSGASIAQVDSTWFEPDPEDLAREAEKKEALTASTSILTARMMTSMAQTETFTTAEITTLAKAGLFEDWTPDAEYAKGRRFVHVGVVYEVQQPVTAQAHQPPGSTGMLAIYRPISVDPETGAEPDGSLENPCAFISGMDVHTGKHYSYAGKLYLAKADMLPCVWNPDTPGLWQWEGVE